MLADGGLTHHRPDYGFRSARMGNDVVGVAEESRFETPFGTLLRFRKDTSVVQPRVLVAAPMSGHFATLLRGTISVLLPDHDVYITDWKNARDIKLSDIVEIATSEDAGSEDGPVGDLFSRVVEPAWKELDDALRARLHELSLDDLIRRAESAGLRRPLAEPISFSI